MSYNESIKIKEKPNYRIIPNTPYQVIRYCGGCNCKSVYISTGEFRVNANGNKIAAQLLGLSRSQIKLLEQEEKIQFEKDLSARLIKIKWINEEK